MKRKLLKMAIGLIALVGQFLPSKAEAAFECCAYDEITGKKVMCVTCNDGQICWVDPPFATCL